MLYERNVQNNAVVNNTSIYVPTSQFLQHLPPQYLGDILMMICYVKCNFILCIYIAQKFGDLIINDLYFNVA